MIDHVLAVAPVADLERACAFYERLLGRAPDNRPMDTLVEWRVTDTGWLQVFAGSGREGGAFVNFAVDDLAAYLDQLRERGLEPGAVQDANKGVQISSITDPDGNTISFIGKFRVVY